MPLLDRFLPSRRRRVNPTETLGAAGVGIYGGYVQSREKSPELSSPEARYRTFANILSNTSVVAAGVRYYVNLVGGAAWSVQPADADTDGRYAALAESALMIDPATPWQRVIRRAAMYRFYGYSVQEWTAKRRADGWLGFADIAPRAHASIERWSTDAAGQVAGIIQRSPQTWHEIYLPREKVMYIVDDTLSDSPEGLGIFRHLVSPAHRLARYEDLEGFGYETDLRNIPVGYAPLADIQAAVDMKEMKESRAKELVKPINDFIKNHIRTPNIGLLFDSSTYRSEDIAGSPSSIRKWDVELKSGGATGFAPIAAAIERLNREMARIMGIEQLLLGGGEGSYALSKDKTHQFYLMVNSALDEIRQVVETDLLMRLWQLNGWPTDMQPTLSVEAVEYRSVEQIAAALRDMATAGAILEPDDPVIADVRDLMGVSQPTMAGDVAPMADMDDTMMEEVSREMD